MKKIIIAAFALAVSIGATGCQVDKDEPQEPSTAVSAEPSVPTETPDGIESTTCLPLPDPTPKEVEGAVVKSQESPGYDGPPRAVTVENLISTLRSCGNASADLEVTYDVTYAGNSTSTHVRNELLTVTFCEGLGWVLNADLNCKTAY